MTICLVDDNQLVRTSLSAQLRHAGHAVMEAADGGAALALMEREPPDLVITDIVMPEKEGIELISQLRERYPDTAIIAMSGGGAFGNNSYLQIASTLGANACLEKPFTHKALLDTIETVMRKPADPAGMSRLV